MRIAFYSCVLYNNRSIKKEWFKVASNHEEALGKMVSDILYPLTLDFNLHKYKISLNISDIIINY